MKRNLLGISLLTLTGLYLLLFAIIILVTIILDIPVIIGVVISIVILILQFLLSPFFTDLSMKWFYKAKFNAELPEYLNKFIDEICEKEKMKHPRMGFIDDGAPNAFTYGHTKNDARIIITRGILDLLTEEEVKAVVGHELGHAVHYDMLFMTVAQLVPLVLYGIYDVLTSSNDNSSSKDSGKAAIIGIIAYVLYIISNYIVLWLSRTREYYADSYSIEATKNPNALASALVKVGYGLTTNSNGKSRVAKSNSLGIFDSKSSKSLVVTSYDNGEISPEHIKNAMKWEMWNPWAFIYQLQSTHPLISKRLLAISAKSKDYGQEPYIVFDLEQPESYVDDFFAELVIKYSPSLAFIIGIVLFIVFMALDNTNLSFICLGALGILGTIFLFIRFKRSHKSGYLPKTIRDLLGEVKVSGVTSVACELEGTVIGKGDPGCIFNEDFTIKDSTGIMFLDYNQ